MLLLRRLGGAVAAALRVGVWLASSLADLRYWRAGISCWLQTLRTEGHWIRLGWVGSGWVGSGWVGGFPIHFDSPSCLYTSVTGRQCQLSDGTPTVARTTTRPSTVRQRFSRRVRRYPVSLGRRTLRRPAHPSGAPATNPSTLEQPLLPLIRGSLCSTPPSVPGPPPHGPWTF